MATPKLAKKLKELVELKAEIKGINFVVDIAENFPPSFMMDNRRLMQVLVNLLTNAAKYTFKGKVELRFSVVTNVSSKAGDFLLFEVEDTGIGIPPERLSRLTTLFGLLNEKVAHCETGTFPTLITCRHRPGPRRDLEDRLCHARRADHHLHSRRWDQVLGQTPIQPARRVIFLIACIS